MRSLINFAVVAVTVLTLMLGAAIGVSAKSGTFGTSHGSTSVSILNNHIDFGFLREKSGDGQGNNKDKDKHGEGCKGDNEHHEHGTPSHKHHPCGNKGDDTD